MKRLSYLLPLCTIVLLAGCQDNPVSPLADGVSAAAQSDNAAIVINQDTGICGMPGADADGNLIFGGIGEVNIIVENNNRVMLSCKGDAITNLSGRARTFTGFSCGIVAPASGGVVVVTTDSRATVTPSGQATLMCAYTKS